MANTEQIAERVKKMILEIEQTAEETKSVPVIVETEPVEKEDE